MEQRELIFKPISWSFEDKKDDDFARLVINVSGLTKENKTVQIQIENFKPYCYLELPTNRKIRWTDQSCKIIFNHFSSIMKDRKPLSYSPKKKQNLYFKKEGYFLFISFNTNASCIEFEKHCRKKQLIPGLGFFQENELKVHEHNIDPILKLTSIKKILLAGWVKVRETIHDQDTGLNVEERKFSTADIDMFVDFKNIEPYTPSEHIITYPSYCSFDIECYSLNHNSKLPDPEIQENEVFQIAMIFGNIGKQEQETYLLTKFNPYPIEGCKVLRFTSEKKLLLKFAELIKKKDPLFFIGYNIMKFDWDYMIKRADKANILSKFMDITRILGQKAFIDKINWSSSAYKEQQFNFPACIGRIHLDVLIEVERNFKLPTYSLNVVAGKFLGEQKDDISPRQLFMFYKITKELLPILEKEELSTDRLKDLQKRIKEILPFRQTHGIVRRHRRHMLNCSTQAELTKLVRECLTMTLKYCRQDTILPIKIIEKLNLITTMEEMSNVMHIPMSYLHTRGQQIKVLAQVFRETIHNGIIIPYNRKVKGAAKENYEGAIVAEAHAGDYTNVGTLDFCITGDTPIATQNGYSIPLKNITKNMRVSGWDGNSYGWYSSEGVIYKGKKETVKVWLQDGTTIDCTPDHKFMLDNGEWCRADELKGKYVKCGLEQPLDSICEKEGSWEMHMDGYILTMKTEQDRENALAFSRLMGYILSDGSIYETTDKNGRTRKCCEVSMGTMIDAEDIMKDIVRFNVPRVTIRRRSRGIKGTTYCITIPAKLSKAIHSIDGIVKGKRATQPMFLPSFILEEGCPKSIQREFLAGLFGGDGTAPFYQKGRHSSFGPLVLKWTTIEKYKDDMMFVFYSMKKILEQRFGISSERLSKKVAYGESSIKPKDSEGENGRWDISIALSTEETRSFHEKIGFRYCINKTARLVIASSFYKRKDTIRDQVRRVHEYANSIRSEKTSDEDILNISREAIFSKEPALDELSYSTTKYYQSRKETKLRIEHITTEDYIENTQTEGWFNMGKGDGKYAVSSDSLIVPSFRKKVIGVFDNGVQDVYDIFEVEKVHNFLAGGIQASNCSLYPTTMIAFNICYSTLATDPAIPDEDCHVLKWISHVGCVHDSKKRKKKDRDGNNIIICGEFKHRFLKVKLSYDEKTKTIHRENEGVMPRLERNLLLSRSEVKKEMMKAEARLKMTRGEASDDDLEFYRLKKFEIIPKGHLSEEDEKKLEVYAGVLNAKQLAIKVSANSAYGALGAGDGFIPLIAGAASVTAMGRELITSAIKKIRETWSNCKLIYGDSVTGDTPITIRDSRTSLIHIIPISEFSNILLSISVIKKWEEFPLFKLDGEDRREKERIDVSHFEIWGNGNWFPIRRLIRHKVNKKIYRVQTSNGMVDVTEDHSLLTKNEEIVKPKNVKIGDELLTSFPIFIHDVNLDTSKILNDYRIPDLHKKRIIAPSILEAQKLFFTLKSLGENVYIGEVKETGEIELLLSDEPYINPSAVISTRIIHETYDDYVYDIETESGQFHAGVGEIILKNTDSCMLVFENCTLREAFDLCKRASKVVTHYLKSWILGYEESLTVQSKSGKCFTLDKIAPFSKEFEDLEHPDKIKILEYDSIPTDLSFECMYGRFLLLTKKRYIAYKVNEDGKVTDITKKGVVLARRDNPPFSKSVYKYISDGILNMKSEQEVLYVLYDEIHKLFTRRVPDTNLIIPVGVNKLLDYAKKKKYDVGQRVETFYIDKNGNPFDDPVGPLDPRLVYPNLPQVILSLRLIRRGTDVPPNTRLEQIFLEAKNAVYKGEKAEDYTYYKENRVMEGLKIDYLFYVDKLQKPITELLNVKCPRTIRIHYEKLEDAIKRVFGEKELDSYKMSMISRTSTYTKAVEKYKEKDIFIGWRVYKKEGVDDRYIQKYDIDQKIYNYKGIDAKIEYVLESYKRGGPNDFKMNNEIEKSIIEVCQKYKAKLIIDKLYTQFKIRKRTPRKPTQTGNKLIKNTGVYILKGDYEGEYGFVYDIHEEENSEKKGKRYTFTIELETTKNIIKNIPREYITSYYLKDNCIMKDIYNARCNYSIFVEDFKKITNPVKLDE